MQISVCICESAASFFTTWKYTIYPSMSCPTNAGLWVIWVSLCRVVLGVTIGKLHQAGTVLFRCPKIRKSKYAWFRLRRSDVCVLNVPSGHIRTCAAVRGSTTLYCEQAYKDFLIFLPKSQNGSRLDAICQPQGCEPPFAGKLILQPWGRKFLVFLCLNLIKKDFQITIFNRLLLVW